MVIQDTRFKLYIGSILNDFEIIEEHKVISCDRYFNKKVILDY